MVNRQILSLLLLSIISLVAAPVEITTMEAYNALCAENKPFVLMFYAPWCGACQGMKDPFNQVEATYAKDITLARINVDNVATKSLKEAFCIKAIPTFITRQSGMIGKDELSTLVEGHIQKTPVKKATSPQIALTNKK